ncbi:Arrestin-N domain-containing protein [Mycena venus]|uniref:Arrestin-N domain-containing protein n=1 Tax=Mycena venus TaxID=2733690 RepID=A0A8H7CDR8_9AGAR|nr:Arrestin-N domain-containing protein [Mycena venus]
MIMTSTQEPIRLRFDNGRVRVAGEIIAGHVDLNVALAQELHIQRLWIKLRGVVKTRIKVSGEEPDINSVTLIREKQSLWTAGSAFPEPGSQILSCHFQFQLPETLPPSFHSSDSSFHAGVISYSLEAVAEKHGRFRANHQVRRLFSVVPAASSDQLLAKESLRDGWTGKWRGIKQEKKMRNGIWGDYSHAHAILSIPDLPSYPINTPIPFRLQISTETKLVHRSDRPEKHGKPLFPAPPTYLSQVKGTLRRVTEIIVRDKTRHQTNTFDLPLTQGLENAEMERVRLLWDTQAVVDEPRWIPRDKDHGIWKRSALFTPTLIFAIPPSHSTEALEWQYELHFVVLFPGMGNDLKLWTPIHLNASSACPGPPGATDSSLPLPKIYLPPVYWSGKDHDWGDDTEDSDTAFTASDAVNVVQVVGAIIGLVTS